MRRPIVIVAGIVIGIALIIGAGYGVMKLVVNTDFSSFVPKDHLAAAKQLVERIRNRQYDQASAMFDPSIGAIDLTTLDQMADLFPRGRVSSVRVTQWNSRSNWTSN